jgi:hypothetical protein
MAVNRLRYPVGLEMESRKLYEAYVRAHETEIGRQLVKKRRLSELHFLCREKLFSAEGMADTIAEAAGTDWAEGTASLMTWKQEYYGVKKEDRYAFD